MTYKEGDRVTFKNYNITKEDGKLIVCDIRQIPTYYKGEYTIDTNETYTLKEGVIRSIWPSADVLHYNWDGEAYIIHCDGDISDDGIAFVHIIPSEWIIENK